MPIASAIFHGVTAAVFEEGGRYLVMKMVMKNRYRFAGGIAFGIGHGGLEAILLVGINALVILVISYANLSSEIMFASGVERLSAMMCQTAFSVMVLKSVREKKPIWLVLALLLHATLDFGAAILSYTDISVFWLEITLGVFALAMPTFVVFEYKQSKGDVTA